MAKGGMLNVPPGNGGLESWGKAGRNNKIKPVN
jgi:hypothetical protein